MGVGYPQMQPGYVDQNMMGAGQFQNPQMMSNNPYNAVPTGSTAMSGAMGPNMGGGVGPMGPNMGGVQY